MSFVMLHPDEPRCHAEVCPIRFRCARAMAGPGRAKTRDYSAGPWGSGALCEGYYDMGHARDNAIQRQLSAARAAPTGGSR